MSVTEPAEINPPAPPIPQPGLTPTAPAMVNCPRQTFTVATSERGVTCTDTIEAFTGAPNQRVYSPRPGYRTLNLGPDCAIRGAQLTVYQGTVSGGNFGTCYNYCAVSAICAPDGWIMPGYTW